MQYRNVIKTLFNYNNKQHVRDKAKEYDSGKQLGKGHLKIQPGKGHLKKSFSTLNHIILYKGKFVSQFLILILIKNKNHEDKRYLKLF